MDTGLSTVKYNEPTAMNIMNALLCSNKNRVGILHLLKKMPNNEMQAERIAQKLGLTHRTVLYHLNILEQNGLIEVRGYRKRGNKLLRSVWGLNSGNETLIKNFFARVDGSFEIKDLNELISRNVARR